MFVFRKSGLCHYSSRLIKHHSLNQTATVLNRYYKISKIEKLATHDEWLTVTFYTLLNATITGTIVAAITIIAGTSRVVTFLISVEWCFTEF